MTEWYVNDHRGVEQGFTPTPPRPGIHPRPSSSPLGANGLRPVLDSTASPIRGRLGRRRHRHAGTYEGGTFKLRNVKRPGAATLGFPDVTFAFGDPAASGGRRLRRRHRWHRHLHPLQRPCVLRQTAGDTAPPTTSFVFWSDAGSYPVAGEWDMDGADTVGVKKGATWTLNNQNDISGADFTITFGTGANDELPAVWAH